MAKQQGTYVFSGSPHPIGLSFPSHAVSELQYVLTEKNSGEMASGEFPFSSDCELEFPFNSDCELFHNQK